jgi:hypothetical protein
MPYYRKVAGSFDFVIDDCVVIVAPVLAGTV